MPKFDYTKKRYWYHLSFDLDKDEIEIYPWDKRKHRSAGEPNGKRLCMAPSVAHCLTAIPQRSHYFIYRTPFKITVQEPDGVYDSDITKEGWITEKIKLKRIGSINLDRIRQEMGDLPADAALVPRIDWCKRCLRQWRVIADFYTEPYVRPKA